MNALLWISVAVVVNCVCAKNSWDELQRFDEDQITTDQFSTTTPESSTTEQSSTSTESTTTDLSTASTTNPCLPISDISLLNVAILGFDAFVQWTHPKLPNCNYEYEIFLNDSRIDSTINLSYTISKLTACTAYEVGIRASLSDEEENGNVVSTFFNTTLPNDTIFGVDNFTYSVDGNNLTVTWIIAEQIEQCVIEYNLTWSDQDDLNSKILEASTTYYELPPLVPCGQYSITVTPKFVDTFGKISETFFEAAGLPTNSPVQSDVQSDKTTITITWIIDDRTINKCPLSEIIVSCEAPDQNEWWVVQNPEPVVLDIGQEKEVKFNTSVVNLSPFTNYTCTGLVVNSEGNSSSTSVNISTMEDVPSEPQLLTISDVTSNSFTINWNAPSKIPGPLLDYTVFIEDQGIKPPATDCENYKRNFSQTIDASNTNFIYNNATPYHIYQIWVYGSNEAGYGNTSSYTTNTSSSKPDAVSNVVLSQPVYSTTETYNATMELILSPACHTNGPFKQYTVKYTGKRQGFKDEDSTIYIEDTKLSVELTPERLYSFQIFVEADFTSDPFSAGPVQSRAGVPEVKPEKLKPPTVEDTTEARFELSSDAFSNENGEIVAYALFLLTKQHNNSDYGFWNGSNASWPHTTSNGCQLTPNLWNPFSNGTTSVLYNLRTSTSPCNQRLTEDTTYWLLVRALTSAAYKDRVLQFRTDMSSDLDVVLGLVFGILAAVVVSGGLFYFWWRKRKPGVQVEEKRPSGTSPQAIPCKKFADYYMSIKEDHNIIKQQYDDLCAKSKEFDMAVTYANLPENKHKNRYTNILPFDQTRITLKMDEDDEISSDYINASYLKGYSGRVEYIATQGPLGTTSKDFWKMISQENVTIIVMVSQFVEQSKEKCSQYFPNNHGSLTFDACLEVKCNTELHFGTYCIRTLQVRKGTEQRNVTHMQFLEWPDFGVPQGTDNMLQFIRQLREKANVDGGLVVVHCSAGVGRTGTLIALDILLQTIDRKEDINIYKTVLDLRRQRTNMVQTNKQYMYIHTCVMDYIETPTIPEQDPNNDHLYENMSIIRSSLKKNLIDAQVESVF